MLIKKSCFDSSNYIQNDTVDLFFCDPPYNILGSQEWDSQWKTNQDFYDWTEKWMQLMYNQLKESGSAYICISWQHSHMFHVLLWFLHSVFAHGLKWIFSISRWTSRSEKIRRHQFYCIKHMV